ncbi:MAG: hypothetical protein LBJ95_00325 [Oscillospiraceae bacterium]|nr:hypothetical protein [Oscillospiraceae bacterium]
MKITVKKLISLAFAAGVASAICGETLEASAEPQTFTTPNGEAIITHHRRVAGQTCCSHSGHCWLRSGTPTRVARYVYSVCRRQHRPYVTTNL